MNAEEEISSMAMPTEHCGAGLAKQWDVKCLLGLEGATDGDNFTGTSLRHLGRLGSRQCPAKGADAVQCRADLWRSAGRGCLQREPG